MVIDLSRRNLIKTSGLALGAGLVSPLLAYSEVESKKAAAETASPVVRLSFNENPYGPSPRVAEAIQHELGRLNRYADASAAEQLTAQIAAFEKVQQNR